MSDIEKKAVSLLVDALNSVAVSKNDNVNNALADRLSKGAKNWAIRKMNINNYCSNTYHLKSIIKPSSKQWKEYVAKLPYQFDKNLVKKSTPLLNLQEGFLDIQNRMKYRQGESATKAEEVFARHSPLVMARKRILLDKLKADYSRIRIDNEDMYKEYNAYNAMLNPPRTHEVNIYLSPGKPLPPLGPPVEDAILLKMRERIRKGERLLERIAGVKTEVLASLVNMERENYLSKVDPTRRDIFKKEFASGDDAIKANAITSAISEKFSDFIIKIPSAVKTNPSPLEYSSRANWKNPSFSKYYTARIRNLINAIKNNDRSLFLDRLKKGELKISKIPDYEIWDIWYKEPKPEDPLPPRAEDMPDGMFKCKNCKSYKTTYVEKQTRSADEPMTIFITCMLCGNVTKI